MLIDIIAVSNKSAPVMNPEDFKNIFKFQISPSPLFLDNS
jgi:hypothetical protein